jgi:hypothetical protein
LPRLASNCDPPDLHLLSSKDYRLEPLVPSSENIFNGSWNVKYMKERSGIGSQSAPYTRIGTEERVYSLFNKIRNKGKIVSAGY